MFYGKLIKLLFEPTIKIQPLLVFELQQETGIQVQIR